MPISQLYYLDAPTLSAASSVFMDSALTVYAPDGFYSDGPSAGNITREQVNGSLLPQQPCPDCGITCDTVLVSSEPHNGVFRIDVSVSAAIGAIKVWLNTADVPKGILAIFNAQSYNKLSCYIDGVHQSSNPYGYTYVGKSADDCGIAAGITYPAMEKYTYEASSSSFVDQGTTQTVVINALDVSLSTLSPGNFLMVIPKPSIGAGIVSIYIVGPCETTNYTLEVECPGLLPEVLGGAAQETSSSACADQTRTSYYFASVSSLSYVNRHDYIFTDANGQYPLPDGFYSIDNNGGVDWIQVINGIVTDIVSCCSPGSTYSLVVNTWDAWNSPANIGNFGFLAWRVRSNGGSWSAPTSGLVATYNNSFGSNPTVTFNQITFGACLEVEIGVINGASFYFPSDASFPGWIWPNCAISYMSVNCINRLSPPPLSSSPYTNPVFTNPAFQPYNYFVLMTPDPTTHFFTQNRYGNLSNSYWRFRLTGKAWVGGSTVVTDPLLGPVGPQTNLKLWVYEPI